MTKEEILHLGTLARIKLTDNEVVKLQEEITSILGYVSSIDAVVKDGALIKEVGPVHNVFREDVISNEPNEYTEAILNEMPDRDGQYLRVKKILNPDL
ncbi:MAG: aspartyl-tRNA(Asn)/glutamyl-tRNA(Gln) amidotransferase subunit C [Candidatus Azotimanducaceae bacterium]|jgi:aspartyl-tRNA(Asn)/glutamyl-tRNA(Gln) amidotransferase subunit C